MSIPSVQTIYRDTHFALNLETSWEEAWDDLVEVYSHPGRVYHDFSHIEEMVLWLWANYPVDASIWAILYAAFYHDYVDTKSKTAEFDSAAIAADKMSNGAFNPTDVRLVAEAIMATATHQSDDVRIQYLIDADLLRFTCEDNRYADQIREEYAEHPDEAFNNGREGILEHFGARDPFFYHAEGSEAALANIARQLAELD